MMMRTTSSSIRVKPWAERKGLYCLGVDEAFMVRYEYVKDKGKRMIVYIIKTGYTFLKRFGI